MPLASIPLASMPLGIMPFLRMLSASNDAGHYVRLAFFSESVARAYANGHAHNHQLTRSRGDSAVPSQSLGPSGATASNNGRNSPSRAQVPSASAAPTALQRQPSNPPSASVQPEFEPLDPPPAYDRLHMELPTYQDAIKNS